ncbi:MAG: (2Fe-2S)-binding protein [Glaciecola sp.]
MFVCLCHGITDKHIEQAVRENGVGNMRELKARFGVGSQCGSCVQMAQDIIDTTIIDDSLFKDVG